MRTKFDYENDEIRVLFPVGPRFRRALTRFSRKVTVRQRLARPLFGAMPLPDFTCLYVGPILRKSLISMIILDNSEPFIEPTRQVQWAEWPKPRRNVSPSPLREGQGDVTDRPPMRKSLISMIISDNSAMFSTKVRDILAQLRCRFLIPVRSHFQFPKGGQESGHCPLLLRWNLTILPALASYWPKGQLC